MVFIFTDVGTYSKYADKLESIIKGHDLRYSKHEYENHKDVLGNDEYVSMTWFCIRVYGRKDFEAFYEDLEKSEIPIALQS